MSAGLEANGRLSLVGVEYIVFQQTWDALHNQPPSLFGQPLMLVPSPNRYGIPAFFELHAWAWKANPTGPFKDWNPKVRCLGTEGHRPDYRRQATGDAIASYHARIETAAADLDWLNKGVFISVGGRRPGGVIYDTYLVA